MSYGAILGQVPPAAALLGLYVWRRRSYQKRTTPEITAASSSEYAGSTYKCGGSYSVDYETGMFSGLTVSATSVSDIGTGWYFWPGTATSSSVMFQVVSSGVNKYNAMPIVGDWEVVQSSSQSAYPNSGVSGGYEYQYLGPSDSLIYGFDKAKIETGSYDGVGGFGSSAPNILTLNEEPKLFFLSEQRYDGPMAWVLFGGRNEALMISFTPNMTGAGGGQQAPLVSKNGKTLSWYSTANEIAQYNRAGYKYDYLAIS